MAWTALLLTAFATLICLVWVVIASLGLVCFRKLRRLSEIECAPVERYPRFSVIVPALNEEATIEAAATTLLASSYPDLEVVLIDDRSTDGTGAIIDRLAAKDARVKPIHIQVLPEGWLGKTHALHCGAEAASGELLLFTDADVHFQPGAFEQAAALMAHEQLDHLAVLPGVIGRTFWLRSVIVAFGAAFMLLVRPHRVGRPGSKAFAGVGAFNLVRKSAYAKTPGLAWLKMEIADDVGLAMMLVQHGCKSACVGAPELVSVEWYTSVPALVRGLEKNMFGVFSHYSLPRFILRMSLIGLLWGGLLLSFAVGPSWLQILGGVVLLAHFGIHMYGAGELGLGPLEGLFAPVVGLAVLLVAMFRSAIVFMKTRGASWRGTFYSAEALRAGQRFKV